MIGGVNEEDKGEMVVVESGGMNVANGYMFS